MVYPGMEVVSGAEAIVNFDVCEELVKLEKNPILSMAGSYIVGGTS